MNPNHGPRGFENQQVNFQAELLEQFTQFKTAHEALSAYGELMQGVAQQHQEYFTKLGDNHEAAFVEEAQTHGSVNVDQRIDKTIRNATLIAESALPQVAAITNVVAETLPKFLSAGDARVLEEVKKEAAVYGVGSYYAKQALRGASSAQARTIIEVSLDTLVLSTVEREADTYGPGSYYVKEALKPASSKTVRKAMICALDGRVLDNARREVRTYGPGSYYEKEALKAASSPAASRGMKAALDGMVFDKVQSESRTYGNDSYFTKEALKAASSKSVAAVFARKLQTQERQSTSQSSYEGYGFTSDAFGNAFRERAKARRESYSRQEQARREPPRTEKPAPQPEKDVEVASIIGQVVARDRQYGWLQREDPRDVRRVINSVRAARQKAMEVGNEVSDRDIYLRYRKHADRGEQGGRDLADPAIVRSFKILDAMMGGNIRGKLPF